MEEAIGHARCLIDRALLRMVSAWVRIRYFLEIGRFRRRMGYVPNAACPRTFNEKLLWRKIFDRSPLIVRLSDKLEAKAYFAERCPSLAQAEVIWSGGDVEAMPASALDGDVVVKSNCGSGQIIFSFAGSQERRGIRDTVRRWMARRRPYGKSSLEWGYSRVNRKVIVEKLIRDETGGPPFNVNVHAADGEIALAHIWRHLEEGAGRGAPDLTAVYDRDLNRLDALPILKGRPNPTFPADFRPPASMATAYEHARLVSRGMDYVRVDFLCCRNEIFAGELTFYSHAGYLRWTDPSTQDTVSRVWDLRKSWFLSSPQRGWRGMYARALRRFIDEEAGAEPRQGGRRC